MGQKMYYYTSTDTMSKILTGGNLFATNLGYMNDAREYVHGLRTVKKTLQENGINVDDIFSEEYIEEYASREKELTYFSISFCENNDLLSQWTTYAKESGVSIEMDFTENEDVEFMVKDDENQEIRIKARPEKIQYVESRWGNPGEIDEVWKRFDSSKMSEKYLKEMGEKISAYIKQFDFVQENEYRIAFDNASMGCTPKIDYRSDKHVLKPYISVECVGGWPITSIMVGPGFNQDVVLQSVRFFLNHAKVKSNKLLTQGQWKEQIEVYFMSGGNEFIEIWNELNKDKSLNGFAERWKALGDDPRKEMDEYWKQLWVEKVRLAVKKGIEKRVNGHESSAEKYRKLVGEHFFTTSGIILKKSDISYIY